MNTRRFTGPSVRQVLTQVRDAFGDDAVIVEQSHIDGTVVVIASAEPIQEANIENQLFSMPNTYVQQFSELGFSAEFLGSLRLQMPTLRGVLDAVLQTIPFSSLERVADERLVGTQQQGDKKSEEGLTGSLQFVGSPGSGKSTALIKVLCHWIATGGDASNALIVSECGTRLGGCERIELAAALLGVQHERVDTQRLRNSVRNSETAVNAQHHGLLLVDREGAAPMNPALGCDRTVLTLPATLSGPVFQDELHRFSPFATDLFVTQVDRTARWGSWLECAAHSDVPMGWVGWGAGLSDGCARARREVVRDALVDQVDQSSSD